MAGISQGINLEALHIIKNYKKLKEEMEPNDIIDFLVQHGILDTDEDTYLLRQCRAKKCDFILRKLIRNPNLFSKFVKCLNNTFKTLEAFHCFCSIPNDAVPETRIPSNEVQGK